MRQRNIAMFDFPGARSAGSAVRRGRVQVVQPWEHGLLFRRGALAASLAPGAYRRWGSGYTLRRVDTRPWVISAPTQEVPTADGVTVKVTVSGLFAVADPEAYVSGAQDVHEALYLAIQIALRAVVAVASVEELVVARADFGQRLTSAVRGLEPLGVRLDHLELKDIVLPADLKRAQAEVLIARAEGVAALERARGETAAMRALANAARMAADNPMLIQLRLIQQLGASPGHTIVIGSNPVSPGA